MDQILTMTTNEVTQRGR